MCSFAQRKDLNWCASNSVIGTIICKVKIYYYICKKNLVAVG